MGFNPVIVDVKSNTSRFYSGRFIARQRSNVNIVFFLDQFTSEHMIVALRPVL